MDEDLRYYTIAEAAVRLGKAPTTLRDEVTRGVVPHHRIHGVRGVRFTDADLAAIRADDRVAVGQRFPRRNDVPPAGPGPAPNPEVDTFDPLSEFVGLTSLRAV